MRVSLDPSSGGGLPAPGAEPRRFRPGFAGAPGPDPSPGGGSASLPAPAPRPYRLLAARLLEGQVARLGRANAVVERRLAGGLRLLSKGGRYRDLGFVRLADYLTERLGLSLRRCQSLLRADRVLSECPLLARAFDAGDLSPSRLEAIAGVVTPETQEFWLARARRLTVRRLQEEVRAGRGVDDPASRDAGAAPASAPAGSATLPSAGAPGPAGDPAEEPEVLVSFPCPGPVLGLWHWSLDLIRRVAGRQEPAWRCAEYLAAEFLSGAPVPDADPGTVAPPLPGATPAVPGAETGTADASPMLPGAAPPSSSGAAAAGTAAWPAARTAAWRAAGASWDLGAWLEATAAARHALEPLGAAADPASILGGRLPALAGGEDAGPPDPWRIDAVLRSLVRLRQSLAWRQGRLIAALSSLGLHRELGYASFEDWCADSHFFSPRRARYLVSLDRRLRDLPALADAYRRGLVSWCQARLLVRVAHPRTERRWIRLARRVTVRRLEACVVEAEVAAAAGGAVAFAEPAAGGTGRHMSAPAASESAGYGAAAAGVGRHTSAPRSPGRTASRITFAAPAGVAALWKEAVAACRRAAGADLDEWECLVRFVAVLRDTWEDAGDPGWRRRYRIFERDGWRCAAPGCTSRGNLHEHHIVFRSQGGSDEDGNLITLCAGHHQQGVHRGRVRCSGRAPEAVAWELGVRRGGPPLARYVGDRLCGPGESRVFDNR